MAGFHLLDCSVLLSLLSKRLDCSLEAKGDGRACHRGVWPVQRQKLPSPVPLTPVQPLSVMGDLGLGLWSTVTLLAFSSYLGCLHPSIFCRMETTGLASAGTWRDSGVSPLFFPSGSLVLRRM